MLHHFLGERYPKLPYRLAFMADNCAGQNKNRWMFWYLSWLLSVHPECVEITMHFMVPGHTKMMNDAKFGLIKRKMKKTECYSSRELKIIVDESGKGQFGIDVGADDTNVPFYKWKDILEVDYNGKIPGVSTHRLFQLRKASPGVCFWKETSDAAEWKSTQLMKPTTKIAEAMQTRFNVTRDARKASIHQGYPTTMPRTDSNIPRNLRVDLIAKRAEVDATIRLPNDQLSLARHKYLTSLAEKYFVSQERVGLREDFIRDSDTPQTQTMKVASLKSQIGELEAELEQASMIGDDEKIDELKKALATLTAELTSLGDPLIDIGSLKVKPEDLGSKKKLAAAIDELIRIEDITMDELGEFA